MIRHLAEKVTRGLYHAPHGRDRTRAADALERLVLIAELSREEALALLEVAEAARTLNALHRDVLGLPTLSQENLDAAAEAWAALRAALAALNDEETG